MMPQHHRYVSSWTYDAATDAIHTPASYATGNSSLREKQATIQWKSIERIALRKQILSRQEQFSTTEEDGLMTRASNQRQLHGSPHNKSPSPSKRLQQVDKSPGVMTGSEKHATRHRIRPRSALGQRPATEVPSGPVVRPQSAKPYRPVTPVEEALENTLPEAIKQSKWHEMLARGPAFTQSNLQHLEQETIGLLQRVFHPKVCRGSGLRAVRSQVKKRKTKSVEDPEPRWTKSTISSRQKQNAAKQLIVDKTKARLVPTVSKQKQKKEEEEEDDDPQDFWALLDLLDAKKKPEETKESSPKPKNKATARQLIEKKLPGKQKTKAKVVERDKTKKKPQRFVKQQTNNVPVQSSSKNTIQLTHDADDQQVSSACTQKVDLCAETNETTEKTEKDSELPLNDEDHLTDPEHAVAPIVENLEASRANEEEETGRFDEHAMEKKVEIRSKTIEKDSHVQTKDESFDRRQVHSHEDEEKEEKLVMLSSTESVEQEKEEEDTPTNITEEADEFKDRTEEEEEEARRDQAVENDEEEERATLSSAEVKEEQGEREQQKEENVMKDEEVEEENEDEEDRAEAEEEIVEEQPVLLPEEPPLSSNSVAIRLVIPPLDFRWLPPVCVSPVPLNDPPASRSASDEPSYSTSCDSTSARGSKSSTTERPNKDQDKELEQLIQEANDDAKTSTDDMEDQRNQREESPLSSSSRDESPRSGTTEDIEAGAMKQSESPSHDHHTGHTHQVSDDKITDPKEAELTVQVVQTNHVDNTQRQLEEEPPAEESIDSIVCEQSITKLQHSAAARRIQRWCRHRMCLRKSAILESQQRQAAAARQIQLQYRCYVARAIWLENLKFLITQHRRQTRKQTRRATSIQPTEQLITTLSEDQDKVPQSIKETPSDKTEEKEPVEDHAQLSFVTTARTDIESTALPCPPVEHNQSPPDASQEPVADALDATESIPTPEPTVSQPEAAAISDHPDNISTDGLQIEANEVIQSSPAPSVESSSMSDLEEHYSVASDLVSEIETPYEELAAASASRPHAYSEVTSTFSPHQQHPDRDRLLSTTSVTSTRTNSISLAALAFDDAPEPSLEEEGESYQNASWHLEEEQEQEEESSSSSDEEEEWERYVDEATNAFYYYNPKRRVSQWTPPENLDAVIDKTVEDEWTVRRTQAVSQELRGEWQSFVDQTTHRTFYYNVTTGESTWEAPESFQTASKPTASRKKSSASRKKSSAAWVRYLDPATSLPYFVNAETNETTWTPPSDAAYVDGSIIDVTHGFQTQENDDF